jgi:hypothetical protein
VNTSQTPPTGDWRTGGYRTAFERVPRPPRTPNPLARELIFGYQGSQNALRIIGAIFLAIGLPFIFFLGRGLPTDLTLAAAGQPATATVISTRVVTSVEVNDVHPVEIKYHYEVSGEKYEAASHALDGSVVAVATVGATIPIEIFPAAPSWSRMKGTKSAVAGSFSIFSFLFPIIGAAMLGWAIRSNRREIRAFREGVPTKGLVIKRGEDTTTEINGKHPFEVHWEFQVDGTTYKGKLSNMNRAILQQALPEEEVLVLYDPKNPAVNTVWIE